jgi:hypothetical protein
MINVKIIILTTNRIAAQLTSDIANPTQVNGTIESEESLIKIGMRPICLELCMINFGKVITTVRKSHSFSIIILIRLKIM